MCSLMGLIMKKENKLKENTLNNKNDVLADSGKITAVKAGMIFPVTAPPIPSGVMLIRDGKIMALGEGIPIPEGAAVLDYSNAYLYPGFIDAGSHLGVNKEPYNYFEDVLDGTDASSPFAAGLHSADAFDAFSPAISRARSAGITTCYIAAGHGNIIDGQGICAKLRNSATGSNMLLPGTEQVNITLGDLPVRSYAHKNQAPMTRMAVYQMLRDKFREASKNPDDESLTPIRLLLEKKLRARIYCSAAQDVERAVLLGEEFDLDFVIDGAHEAWKLPGFLKEHHMPVVLNGAPFGPVLTQVAGWYDFSLDNAAVLADSGCPLSLTADESASTALLPYMAGFLISRGLSALKALEAITIRPAEVLGLQERTGSLEAGKDADFTVYSGDALVSTSRCLGTYIEGQNVFTPHPGI